MTSPGAFLGKAMQGVVGMTMAVPGGTKHLKPRPDGGPNRPIVFDLIRGHGGGTREALGDIGGKIRPGAGDPCTEALPDFRALQHAIAF